MEIVTDIASKVIESLKAAIAKSPTGVSMVSIRGYQNSHGEISNNKVNIGASLERAKAKDIISLRGIDLTQFRGIDLEVLEEARVSLISSFESPSENRSKAQIEAYTIITRGVKVHNVTGEIYVYGLRIEKTVVIEGTYPEVKSKPLTIAKNKIRKTLKSTKFTQYKISSISEIRVSGEEISFL